MLFLLSGIVFISGAVLMDILSLDIMENTFFYRGFVVGMEEVFELLGSVMALFTIIDYAERNHGEQLSNAISKLKP